MATIREKVKLKVLTLLNDIRPHLEMKLEKLLDSGLIDFEKEDDTWGLPKDTIQALTILCVDCEKAKIIQILK